MSRLEDALAAIGQDSALRDLTVKLCHEIETRLAKPEFDVREQLTGPIVDALHRDTGVLQKRLEGGLTFHFRYSGKIARDFVMSSSSEPDHVWEPQTTKLLLHLAANAQTVFIAGAYAGDQALLVAQQLRKTGGVCHCFEPNAAQLAVLKINATKNSLAQHMALNGLGLWDEEGADLYLVGDDACASAQQARQSGESARIATTTIDAYGERNEIDRIDVIMLDVEGGEHAILRGASRYLTQPSGQAPHVVFEVHRSYVDWSDGLENTDIGRFLRAHGYKLYAVRDYQSNVAMGDQPIELVEPASAYLEGPPHGFNMLAVKDETVLRSASFRFCSGVSPKLLRHRDPKLHQPLTGGS